MRRLMVSLTLICFCLCVRAQEVKPYLRLETGTHTAEAYGVDVDAAQPFLVSASADKTARVWDLKSGKLLKVLRPPIGDSDEGKLDAVAISPDGKSVAVGGLTGAYGSNNFPIYIFDRESGAIRRSITGLPDVTHSLAYSRNGRYLAAALYGSNGLRIYETAGYTEVAHATDYGDTSLSVEFDTSGRLATASVDGYVRLYDSDFHLLRKEKPPSGKRPHSASFSPDGNLIAVGFVDVARVDVLSGKDLKFQFTVEAPTSQGGLSRTSWSVDGGTLCAAGLYLNSDIVPILCWAAGGKGAMSNFPVANNTVTDLRALRDGGFGFAIFDGTVGVLDHEGRIRWRADPEILDFRPDRSFPRLSSDGSSLQSAANYFNGSHRVLRTLGFSVRERKLEVDPKADASLASSVTSGLSVESWKNAASPTLNGKALKLRPNEIARSLAIAPEQNTFVLGAEWDIYRFDREGNQVWRTPVPGVAWGVNVSADGRFVVAALNDGTLRWYTFDEGKEVLALFVDRDLKRWVIWTPSGYYDASPGGEGLFGWHINNGTGQAADFYPASRFRETKYRPDVVSKVLTTQDEAKAVQLANAERGKVTETKSIAQIVPPVITITSPEEGTRVSSTSLSLQYSIRTPSGEPVTGMKVLIDGRPVIKAAAKAGERQTITATIPERDCQVSLIAENRFSASVPATVHLTWAGAARGVTAVTTQEEGFVAKPKLYVLAVGESNYQNKDLKLGFPAKDAKDFAAAMQKQKGSLYRDVEVKLLADAPKEDIEDGLDWLQHQVTSRDVAMLFLAGHGVNDSTNVYYFLPANADLDRLKRTGLVFSDIKTTMESIAGKVLMFVDTCHSGNVMGTRRGGSMDINGLVNELASAENGVVVFAASTGRQYSLEDAQWQNGAFTKALVEGIGGKAAYEKSGKITISELEFYISERVKELTKGQQTPTTTKPSTVPDFPVAVKQ